MATSYKSVFVGPANVVVAQWSQRIIELIHQRYAGRYLQPDYSRVGDTIDIFDERPHAVSMGDKQWSRAGLQGGLHLLVPEWQGTLHRQLQALATG